MGKALVVLPEKHIRMVGFSDEERRLYECLESMSRDPDVMNRCIGQGTAMKNYGNASAMLMRPGRICNHPYSLPDP